MYSTPYFVIYVDLGGCGPPTSFSLIPIQRASVNYVDVCTQGSCDITSILRFLPTCLVVWAEQSLRCVFVYVCPINNF